MSIQEKPAHFTPTIFQSGMDQPLRSEQRTGEILPRVLSRVDLLILFIAVVVFIPDAAVVQTTQTAGASTYLFWIVGTLTFLLPGAIVTWQLNHLMPAEGSIYVWSHRALGSLWGFFAGFCAWFPGVLVLLTAGDFIRSLIQGIVIEISGSSGNLFTQPWQQGVLLLLILLLAGWFSVLPLRPLMRVATVIVVLYGAGIMTVGLAGVVWLLSGHPLQFSFTFSQVGSGTDTLALYGVIVLALLGIEVPLNMAAETRQPHAARLFLRWGPLLVLLAYLISTFGVAAVVPSSSAGEANSTLASVGLVFGVPAAILVGVVFIGFFLLTAVAYNITFARILFVAALDHRLPTSLSKVNTYGAPARATTVQTLIVMAIAVAIYFLGPLLYPGINFSTKVFYVIEAATTVIWCISMIILFLDLPILMHRFRELLAKKRDQLIAPRWVLYLCSILGGIASLVGIWATLSSSWDTTLIPNDQWWIIIGTVVFVSLILGLVGSAYPRLLSSLDEQTAAARENARLYEELRVAYVKLSELDQLKDAFLMTASHELRTPLTIMQGYLELLREMKDASPDQRHLFIDRACRACDELILLQANIMDASRIEFDAATLHCNNVELKNLCTAVVDLFEAWMLKEQRSIEIDVAPDMMVWADEARLKQVLHNLIANAMRYSPQQTPIRIVAKAVEDGSYEGNDREPVGGHNGLHPTQHHSNGVEGRYVRISVIDRGWGIPPEKQAVIFDKFVRLERDLHGDVRGSGLGLYITQQLVEAMNGTITVESSGVRNEGSTFSFTLPLASSGVLMTKEAEMH
jgi:signal transduction histidine kinase